MSKQITQNYSLSSLFLPGAGINANTDVDGIGINENLVNNLNPVLNDFANLQIGDIANNSSNGTIGTAYTITANQQLVVYADCSAGTVYVKLPSAVAQKFPIKIQKIDSSYNRLIIIRDGLTAITNPNSGTGGTDTISVPTDYKVSPTRVALWISQPGDYVELISHDTVGVWYLTGFDNYSGKVFFAKNTAGGNVSNTYTKINLNSTNNFVKYGLFSDANDRFTPQVAGTYIFNFGLSTFGSTANRPSCALYKNGILAEEIIVIENIGGLGEIQFSVDFEPISANGETDYFELFAKTNSGSFNIRSSGNTSLTGILINKTYDN